jgi:hypothetical protein
LGERPVERRGCGKAPLAGSQQAPDHPAAEAEADRGDRLARDPAAQLADGGLHVGVEARRRDGRERGGDGGLVGEVRGAAFLGEQVERERRPAARREAPRDVADVVDEAAVLVMTRTEPFARPPAGAHAAMRLPAGPANVIGCVATGPQSSILPSPRALLLDRRSSAFGAASGQALAMAAAYGIAVVNVALDEHRDRLQRFVDTAAGR